MYASSEKKLDILNDHYKDTFSHLVSYRKQGDRLLIDLLRTYAVECSKPCSSAIYRRRTQCPTPDESPIYRDSRETERATTVGHHQGSCRE